MKLLLPLVLAFGLAGCQTVLHVNDEDAQAIINKQVLGMSVGDFFQRYGAPRVREEQRDGTYQFIWEGGLGNVAAGPRGLEELICRLRIDADRGGKIVAVPIIRDAKGERRLSRCAELFDKR